MQLWDASIWDPQIEDKGYLWTTRQQSNKIAFKNKRATCDFFIWKMIYLDAWEKGDLLSEEKQNKNTSDDLKHLSEGLKGLMILRINSKELKCLCCHYWNWIENGVKSMDIVNKQKTKDRFFFSSSRHRRPLFPRAILAKSCDWKFLVVLQISSANWGHMREPSRQKWPQLIGYSTALL